MANSKPAPAPEAVKPAPVTYTKAKLLTFKRYAHRRDLLTALLKDGQEYTVEQVDGVISDFMKGKVK